MEKERYINLESQRYITSVILSEMLIFICLLALTDAFMPKFKSNTTSITYAVVIAIILVPCIFIFFCNLLQLIQLFYKQHHRKYSYLRYAQYVNRHLGNEFTPVKLKHFDDLRIGEILPEDSVICTAKLDKNGNIIYQVHIDVEMETKNYHWFLSKFKVYQNE